jgi:nucleoside-diphosphate-sugar epimerase
MILVTGGTGVMGSRLVRALCSEKKRVRVVALPSDPHLGRLKDLDCEIVYGDITDRGSLSGVCRGVTCVFHLAAVIIAPDKEFFERVNVDGSQNILQESISGRVEHFIFVSSISVTYSIATPYSISKSKCEEMIVKQGALRWTIVRPTLTYDRDGGQEFVMFMNSLLQYPAAFLVGRGQAKKNPVYVEDLIRGLLAIPENRKAYNKIYNLCGSEEITIRELAKLILELRHKSRWVVPVPVWLCKLAALAGEFLTSNPPLTWNGIVGIMEDANPDWSQAHHELGYSPMGVTQGLRRCLSD